MAVFDRNSLTDNKPAGGLHLRSRRGQVGVNWWSRRFLGMIEAAADQQALEIGRRMARKSQVLSLTVEPGKLCAEVQETRDKQPELIYEMAVLSPKVWEDFVDLAISDCLLLAQLFAGMLPENIEERLNRLGCRLFDDPLPHLACGCTDESHPCTHIVAAACVFAEQMDVDPFVYLEFRGLDRLAFTNAVRRRWGGQEKPRREKEAASPLSSMIECFYSCPGPLPDDNALLKLPQIDILKRLGKPPFLPPADQSMNETLRDLYVE